jgi:hypothetical protein
MHLHSPRECTFPLSNRRDEPRWSGLRRQVFNRPALPPIHPRPLQVTWTFCIRRSGACTR